MDTLHTPQREQAFQPETDSEVLLILKRIVDLELSGVIRYTHYALMVSGPNRIPQVEFFKQQAAESLAHAQRAGEILTGLGGHPDMQVTSLEETHQHDVKTILEESCHHESAAIQIYFDLASKAAGKSVFLEEFARSMVATEEEHLLELRKMMRDLG